MPELKFRPKKNILKTAEYSSIFLVAFSSLFVARSAFPAAPPASGGQSVITVQTWDQIDNSNNNDADPGGSTQLLQGLNAAGSTAAALYQGSGPTAKNGDLIELGYYQLADNSANPSGTNLFAGTWRPLTTKTTIGHVYDGSFWSDTSKAGEFFFDVTFSRETTGSKLFEGTAGINMLNDSGYEISDDTPSGLGGNGSGHLYNLDAATYNETLPASARLGLRFYDVSQGATTGWAGPDSDNRGSATKYQTIMNPDWKWDVLSADNAAAMYIHLHNNNGSVNTNLQFEFDNTDARTANISKIGTGDGGANPNGFQLLNDDFVTTIAYHDGSSGMNLGTSGIGSAIVSGFTGTGTIDGKNDGNILTINSMAGNTGTNAFNFSGDIYQDGTTSTDLTIIKEGGGEQILSGNVNASDSNNAAASAYLDIQEGTVILKPGSGKTQKFEYLTGASSGTRALTLDNSNEATQTIELGFANTSSTQTFSGTVALEGDNTSNTIKVVSDTAKTSANYNKEQVISGIVSGSETLIKDGLGRLMLSGANTFDGGGTDVIISDGTLVAGHADALGGANTTVRIDKGKLEIGDGSNGAVTLHSGTTINGSAVGKSMVGGDGTIAALVVGSDTSEVDVISPGRGISSSLSSTTSQQQVTFGTGGAASSMGDLTVTALSLFDGGVYDWEITNFTGSAGNGFDILKFNTLAFDGDSSASFGINAFSVSSSLPRAGGASNIGVHTGNDGILFLDGPNHAAITWGHANHTLSSGSWQEANYFTVDSDPYNYYNGGLNGGWSVWYNGSGDFYLRYSAVPEPSTYVMVLGMLLVPGFRFFRRFRKGIKQEDQ